MSVNISKLFDKPVQFYVALLLLIIAIFYRPIKKISEGFLSPGDYPRDSIYPLLYENYQLKKKHYKQVSKNNYSDNYESYPVFSSDSLKINNVRYWKTPDNGKCSRAEFCDVLYDEKMIPDNKLNDPQPEWGQERVNYYETALY
jgi:hypothetical protein